METRKVRLECRTREMPIVGRVRLSEHFVYDMQMLLLENGGGLYRGIMKKRDGRFSALDVRQIDGKSSLADEMRSHGSVGSLAYVEAVPRGNELSQTSFTDVSEACNRLKSDMVYFKLDSSNLNFSGPSPDYAQGSSAKYGVKAFLVSPGGKEKNYSMLSPNVSLLRILYF